MKKHLPFLDIYYLSLQRTLFILPSHSAGPSLLSFSFTVSSHLGHAMPCVCVCVCASARSCCWYALLCDLFRLLPSFEAMLHVSRVYSKSTSTNDTHFSFCFWLRLFFFLHLFCSFRFQCRNKNMRVWFWAEFLRFPSTLADFVWTIFASQFTINFFFCFFVCGPYGKLTVSVLSDCHNHCYYNCHVTRDRTGCVLIFARSRSSSGDERHQIDTNIFRKKIFSFCFATHFSHRKFFMFICFISLPPSPPLCLSFFVRALFVSRFFRNKIMFMFSLIWFNIYFLCWKLYEVTGCSWAAFVYELVFENAKESLLSE